MATESPMRLIKGGGGEGKGEGGSGSGSGWSVKSSRNLRFALLQDGDGDGDGDASEEELGSLLNASKFKIVKCSSTSRHGVPNRSGSAPPTVEGSLSAMVGQGQGNWQWRRAGALGVEDQLPHNYFSRLPAQGERNRVIGSNKLRSLDDSNSRSLFSSGPPLLPTHNEEPESEDRFPIANLNLLVRQTSSSFSSEWLERERERASDYFAGMSSTALGGRPKSLVDLIQQDFPRTPSPVYNLSRSSSRAANDEGIEATNLEAQLMFFGESAISATKTSELSGTHSDSCSATGTPSGMHMIRVGSTSINLPAAPVARIPSPDSPLASAQSGSHGEALVGELTDLTEGSITGNSELNSTIFSSVSTSDTSNLVHVMQSFSIVDMEDNANKKQDQVQQEEKQAQHFNLPQQQYQRQQRVHVPSVHGRVQSQALTQALHQQHQHHTAIEQALHNQSKFSTPSMTQGPTMGLQPTFQSGGASAPHLYATAAAYMASGNPYLQNLQSALYAPQYGITGYPMNTSLLTPLMTGYPHGSMPMVFDNAAAAVAASMNVRAAATAAHVGGLGVGVDMQQLYKFNGQLGTTLQPALTGPAYLHYLQRSAEDAYNNAVVVGDPLAVRGFVGGSQMDILEMQKASMIGYGTEHKSQFNRSGTLGVPIASKSGSVSPAYYGTPSVGLVMQYPSSPLANPVLPGSAGRATSLLARPIEQNFCSPLGSNRLATMGAFTGWQLQRGNEKVDDLKCSSFLEELKNNKTHRFELSDIAGHIVEFSADQQGSRFIQQKLETSSAEEKALVFQEVLPQASVLMTDVFGNYVIQKFFEHGTDQQRMELANQLFGHVLALSLQMYGCRVVQKALEVVNVDLQTQLVSELDGSVMRCVRDQNGNHVIQKCIECVPTERLQFIISSFYGQVVTLSTHPYGCRVIQRVLEHCTYEQKNQGIMEEILEAVCNLSQDQYGNYVAQHVLEHGKPRERSIVINKLAGQVVQMSQHKFASNVVEKCLEYGDPIERQMLIDEMLGTDENDNFQIMMKDQYGNYVVQKVLETCNDQQREKLLTRIRVHLHALKKYTYGKHIVARVEKLLAVGEKRSSQV